MLTSSQLEAYRADGYVVARGLVTSSTVQTMTDHYMRLRAAGRHPGDLGGRDGDPTDPLNSHARMIDMHLWDASTAAWAGESALLQAVAQLLDDAPRLFQTMLYFKPPGARGQALHQDEQYIPTTPLLGAWLALDAADAANGQMVVVPGSARLGLLPVEPADRDRSFVAGQATLPPGLTESGIDMAPGDCLFFDGKTVHGSHANVTRDRFRRSFICHFVGARSRAYMPPPTHSMNQLEASARNAA